MAALRPWLPAPLHPGLRAIAQLQQQPGHGYPQPPADKSFSSMAAASLASSSSNYIPGRANAAGSVNFARKIGASAGSGIASTCSDVFVGEFGNLSRYAVSPIYHHRKRTGVRAVSDDVPSYKGYAPMLKKPRWWWRVLACIPYMMPLSETWMYAETAYSVHSFLEDYEFCTYRFLTFIGTLPSWFLLAYFFGAYLGIVRNNRWPHFFRFHVVTGMLLEIIVQVVGTVNDWVPPSLYWGKLGAHYWLAISFAFFFIVIECIRCALSGMYADVPFLSDASYMQIPYDT